MRREYTKLRNGLPFLVLCIGGYVWSSQFVDGRIKITEERNNAAAVRDMTQDDTVDEEELIQGTLTQMRKLTKDDYTMIPIARPNYEEVMGGHPDPK